MMLIMVLLSPINFLLLYSILLIKAIYYLFIVGFILEYLSDNDVMIVILLLFIEDIVFFNFGG
jgi:hypothetical protein